MRRHTLPEPDYDENADGEMLARTLNLLLPIRRQRLSRSERQQREAENALRALDVKTTEAEQQLLQNSTITSSAATPLPQKTAANIRRNIVWSAPSSRSSRQPGAWMR